MLSGIDAADRQQQRVLRDSTARQAFTTAGGRFSAGNILSAVGAACQRREGFGRRRDAGRAGKPGCDRARDHARRRHAA